MQCSEVPVIEAQLPYCAPVFVQLKHDSELTRLPSRVRSAAVICATFSAQSEGVTHQWLISDLSMFLTLLLRQKEA